MPAACVPRLPRALPAGTPARAAIGRGVIASGVLARSRSLNELHFPRRHRRVARLVGAAKS
jgi:hypothetical protein